jgi:flagellar protein FliS
VFPAERTRRNLKVYTAPRGAEAYRRMAVETRSPMELVVMLYDGALRFLDDARGAVTRQDVPARAEAISRTLAILTELQGTLNIQQGGEIADRLDGLYAFSISRLLDVTTKQDVAAIDDVVKVLRPLRDSWAQLAQPGAVAARP